MKDKMQIREEHRALLRQLAEESNMLPTAIAKDIGVAPSTLNKVLEDGEKHTHVLSTPTLYKLQEFRARVASGAVNGSGVNTKVRANSSQQIQNARLLAIWGALDDDVKVAALEFLEVITRNKPD